jgi:hypothetical protein
MASERVFPDAEKVRVRDEPNFATVDPKVHALLPPASKVRRANYLTFAIRNVDLVNYTASAVTESDVLAIPLQTTDALDACVKGYRFY